MKPSEANARLRQAVEHHNRNELAAAEQICRQVLAAQPNQADALHLLARVCLAKGDSRQAIDLIEKAISVAPEMASFRNTACEILNSSGRLDAAMMHALRAVEIDPGLAAAHHNLCLVQYARGELAAALVAADRVVSLRPDWPVARLNRGILRHELGDLAGAEADYRQASSMDPGYRLAVLNLARLFAETKLLDDAEQGYSAWLHLHPDDAGARFGLAGVRLMRGRDWGTAWADFEARWNVDSPGSRRMGQWPNLPPRVDLEGFAGHSVLLYAEQGLGDSIQMLRYVPELLAFGLQITLLLPASLRSLVARNFSDAETLRDVKVVSALGQGASFDFEFPLMSLPGWVGLDGPPQASSAYLVADREKAARMDAWVGAQEEHRLAAVFGGVPEAQGRPKESDRTRQSDRRFLRVGLVWQGGGAGPANRRRRLLLADLVPLARLRDRAGRPLSFVSLQYGAGEQHLGDQPIVDFADRLAHFDDLAAAMASVDLVVSLDTGPAHLAGALGLPVFLLVPWLHDWRWGVAGDTSPWYPDMTLFRQAAPGDWRSAIEQPVSAMKDRFALLEASAVDADPVPAPDEGAPMAPDTATDPGLPDASLRGLLGKSVEPTQCKACGKGPLNRVGTCDFNRTGVEPSPFPLAGLAVSYWQCNACRFVWAPDFDSWDDALFRRHIYNGQYDRVETGENAVLRAANITSMLRQWLAGFPPSTRLLDYGCGPGLLVDAANQAGFRAVGYDRFHGGFQEPPSGKFDVITCFEVLEHVNRIDEAIDDILRFLAPNGILIVGTFLVPKPFSVDWWYCAPRSGHISLWTFESLSAVFHRRKLNVGSDGTKFHFVFPDSAKPLIGRMFGSS